MEKFRIFQARVDKQYDFAVYQLGYEKCPKDHSFGPFQRDCYMLHFIKSGKGKYRVRGKTYELNKGDCFMVIPDEDTYYEADREDPYEYYWVGFRGVNTQQVLENIGFLKNETFVYHSSKEEYDVLLKYMDSMVRYEKVDEKAYMYILGSLYFILSLLTPSANEVKSSVREGEDLWKRVAEYLAFNYGQNITVDGLAHDLGYHRTALYKLFKRHTNMSPSEYILNYRLDKALSLVKRTDLRFKTIAIQCGFNDQTYFFRVFKKKYKRTPKQIRDLN